MKTLTTILAAICFTSLQTFASQVVFDGFSNNEFTVVYKGDYYNSHNGKVKISNVTSGNNNFKIISVKYRNGSRIKTTANKIVYIPKNSVVYADVLKNNSVAVNHITYKNNYKPRTIVVHNYHTHVVKSQPKPSGAYRPTHTGYVYAKR